MAISRLQLSSSLSQQSSSTHSGVALADDDGRGRRADAPKAERHAPPAVPVVCAVLEAGASHSKSVVDAGYSVDMLGR